MSQKISRKNHHRDDGGAAAPRGAVLLAAAGVGRCRSAREAAYHLLHGGTQQAFPQRRVLPSNSAVRTATARCSLQLKLRQSLTFGPPAVRRTTGAGTMWATTEKSPELRQRRFRRRTLTSWCPKEWSSTATVGAALNCCASRRPPDSVADSPVRCRGLMVRIPACIADAYRWCTPTRSATLSGRLPVHVFENAGGGTCNKHFGIPRGMTAIGTKLKEAGCEHLHYTL